MTLLAAPQLSRHLVDNPNLAAWLEECAEVSLVLAIAPAGFGKTTALLSLHERLREKGFATAWIQLSADDNHVERLCALLDSALAAGAQASPAQPLPNLMDARYTGSRLGQDVLDAVAALQQPTAIFLDDFDHLREARAVDLMQRLIERLPPQCKLFISARSAPLLRLYKLKAQGRLLQIGMAELSFDLEQAELFLNQRHQLQLDAASVRRLLHATEGWPAGLQLAALALKARGDKRGFIENFCEQTADIGRYLYEEVFWDQAEEIKTFLLQTSFIKQLGPGICNAVCQISNAATLLRQLEQQGLFVLRMGAAGTEFRYHPLFAEFLLRKLGEDHPNWLPELHQRAADWFLQAGDPGAAVDHALAAGNHEQACAILVGHVWQALARGHISTCRHWLAQIPPAVQLRHPELLVALSWAHIFRYEYAQASELAEQLKHEPAVQAMPEYRLLSPLSLVLMDRLSECEAALQNQEVTALGGLSEATFRSISAYVDLCSHRFDAAIENADRSLQLFKRMGSIYGTTFSHGISTFTLLAQGRALQVIARLEPALAELSRVSGRHSASSAYVGIYLAGALYEVGEFERAASLAREYLDLSAELVFLDAIVIAHRILSRTLCRAGQYAEAAALIHAGTELGRSLGLTRIVAPMRLEQQYQVVHQFDHGHPLAPERLSLLPAAWDFAADRMTPINDVEDQVLAGLRLGLRDGRAEEVLEACQTKRDKAQKLGRRRRQLKLGLLQAQALASLQHEGDALQLLADLLLADGELALRATYLEEGPQLIALLERLRQQGHSNPAHTPRLKALLNLVLGNDAQITDQGAAMPEAAPEASALDNPASSMPPDTPLAAPVIDCGLSPRELQILQCLSAGMPNKLIANSLHISEPTVKFHLRNINHKLDARNRTHAVFIARERGWVS
ncbi:LuxR C-terminal-related transcriptional regulator [Paucibacter sp. Y2R2-4]|uniref:LuxR C-terminal-related transcriptional regulator n=1 Tax=Paucibacter sp. Y2R2-4 TaxID=2893553 RepID=UPI0021E497D5|nr:LuxR C-terminal-related transcriptional regulator [Paucibacter sp. Y2R2-4]MCV2351018.1 LuxR C-terminal-related transcriptional regulator [Paucibacter sp. Y2R2-4]